MKKGLGNKAQVRGHKRMAKSKIRKQNKHENLSYVASRIFKYEGNFFLKESPKAGERYIDRILNDK
jgi:hypothetical protein